jgi:Tfp pilus assembly protein PilV
MMRRDTQRRGAVLIDVILGVTVLSIAGVGFVTLLAQNFLTVDQLRARERETAGASQQLERMASLWGVADFDARLGTRRSDGFVTTVIRRAVNLYDVEIADSTGARTLLKTTMYAADTSNAAR